MPCRLRSRTILGWSRGLIQPASGQTLRGYARHGRTNYVGPVAPPLTARNHINPTVDYSSCRRLHTPRQERPPKVGLSPRLQGIFYVVFVGEPCFRGRDGRVEC